MATMILPLPNDGNNREAQENEQIEVMVHIQAEIMNPNLARRRANIWLTMNAGHLLMAQSPELILEDVLQWRFDVILSIPQHVQSGLATQNRIGQIRLDARTGEVVEPLLLVEEYRQLLTPRKELSEFFQESPLAGANLDLERDKSIIRGEANL